MAWCLGIEGNLTPTEKSCLAMIAYHDGRPDGCFPSEQRLAELLNMKQSTFRGHKKALREKGYLTWERRRRQTNVYQIAYRVPF